MNSINGFIKKVNLILLGICGIFISLAAFLASVNAILRFMNITGFAFADELCVYLIAVMVFLAIGYLDYTDGHLTIDIFNSTVKNQVIKKVVLFIRGIITMICEGMLIYYGIIVTQTAILRGTVTNVMHIPRFYIYGIVTIGFIVAIVTWLVILICRKGEFEKC